MRFGCSELLSDIGGGAVYAVCLACHRTHYTIEAAKQGANHWHGGAGDVQLFLTHT